MLIDARHGLKEVDLDVLKTLDKSAVSYQVVLTKADQIKPAELESRIGDIKTALSSIPAAFPDVLATSSRNGYRNARNCGPRWCACLESASVAVQKSASLMPRVHHADF